MNQALADLLFNERVLSDKSKERIDERNRNRLFSVHWEIKTALYVGIIALTTGLGILIYKNIDSIGHQVILAIIALLSAGCFAYCIQRRQPFSHGKVTAANMYSDYVLLLGTISFLSFIGYLQFQYTVFGTHYGMAVFIPMLALFFIAYRFDHLGILSMAIANLALWMGVAITPRQLLSNATFNSEVIIYTYLALGLLLLAASFFTVKYSFKQHFQFSYQHYGIHVAFIALLAAYFFYYDSPLAFVFPIIQAGLAYLIYKDAVKAKSFYFLLLTVLYTYIIFSAVMIRLIISVDDYISIYLVLLYFILSGVGMVRLFQELNKKLR